MFTFPTKFIIWVLCYWLCCWVVSLQWKNVSFEHWTNPAGWPKVISAALRRHSFTAGKLLKNVCFKQQKWPLTSLLGLDWCCRDAPELTWGPPMSLASRVSTLRVADLDLDLAVKWLTRGNWRTGIPDCENHWVKLVSLSITQCSCAPQQTSGDTRDLFHSLVIHGLITILFVNMGEL